MLQFNTGICLCLQHDGKGLHAFRVVGSVGQYALLANSSMLLSQPFASSSVCDKGFRKLPSSEGFRSLIP